MTENRAPESPTLGNSKYFVSIFGCIFINIGYANIYSYCLVLNHFDSLQVSKGTHTVSLHCSGS